MQSNIDASLSAVLAHEGGYVNNPKDNGGPTNLGVTLTNFRRFVKPGGTIEDLKKLTKAQAKVVFQRQYWDTVLASQLPSGVDYATFDMSVHSGPKLAAKYLQRSLGTKYTGKVDGVVGPKTIEAAASLPAADIVKAMLTARMVFLQKHEDWKTFGKGWTSRLNGVRKLALELAAAGLAEPVQPAPPIPAPTPATDDKRPWWAVLIELIINFIKGLRK